MEGMLMEGVAVMATCVDALSFSGDVFTEAGELLASVVST
jgi:hypothetical protein